MKIRDGIVKKSWCLAIIFLFVGASVVPHVGSEKIELERSNLLSSNQQDKVHVNDDYNNTHPDWNVTHFDNIQDGIDHVNAGGTVSVHNGTYYENVVIDKKLTLMGVDEDEWGNDNFSIIDGNGIGNVVFINADEVTITGFTITNSGPGNSAGIYCAGKSGITIEKNVIKKNSRGIILYECHGPFYVNENNVLDNEYGIWLNGGYVITIGTYNHIKNNRLYGIVLEDTYKNDIVSNEVRDNGRGIGLFRSFNNDVNNNNFRSNGESGKDHIWQENCLTAWNNNHYNPRYSYNLGNILPIYVILVWFHFKFIPYLSIPIFIQVDWLAQRDPHNIPEPDP